MVVRSRVIAPPACAVRYAGSATTARPATVSVSADCTAARSAPGAKVTRIASSRSGRFEICWATGRVVTTKRPAAMRRPASAATAVTVTVAAPSFQRSPTCLPVPGPAITASGVDSSVPRPSPSTDCRSLRTAAMLASAPSTSVCSGPTPVRTIAAALPTPGVAATPARNSAAKPESVMPETSNAASPAIDSVSRSALPVTEPVIANTATISAAATATTSNDVAVRPRWARSSRRLHSRTRSNPARQLIRNSVPIADPRRSGRRRG
ncbi:hypothetical protein SKPI104516_14580 [Skermania piniformis]